MVSEIMEATSQVFQGVTTVGKGVYVFVGLGVRVAVRVGVTGVGGMGVRLWVGLSAKQFPVHSQSLSLQFGYRPQLDR